MIIQLKTGKVFILIFALFFIECNTEHDNSNRVYYVGKFRININKSRLRSYSKDSNFYRSLTLELKENDSFYFSMYAPFMRRQRGKWNMKAIDNLYTAYLSYDTTNYGITEDHMGIGDKEIFINAPIGVDSLGTDNRNYADYLFFDKIK